MFQTVGSGYLWVNSGFFFNFLYSVLSSFWEIFTFFVVFFYIFSIFHHESTIVYDQNFIKRLSLLKVHHHLLPVFTLKERKEGGYSRHGQDISTVVETETILNEVGLCQEHKAASLTFPSSEAGVVPSTSPSSVSISGQEIQLELMVLEMGKYLDIQIYVLSNSPIIQKLSKAVKTLSLEPTHALEIFPATGVIKGPSQEMHIFNQASDGPLEK